MGRTMCEFRILIIKPRFFKIGDNDKESKKHTDKGGEGSLDGILDISPVAAALLRHTDQSTNQNRQTDDAKL